MINTDREADNHLKQSSRFVAKLGNVLLLPMQRASVQVMFICAEAIRDDGRYQPIIVLDKPWSVALEMASDGIDLLWLKKAPQLSSTTISTPTDKPSKISAMRQVHIKVILYSFLMKITGLPIFAFGKILLDWRDLHRNLTHARRIFDKHKPVAVLLTGDRNLGIEAAMIRAARERGCPTVVVPFAYSGSDDVAYTRIRRYGSLHKLDSGPFGLLKRWIRRKYPTQIYQSVHGPLIFFTPTMTIALSLLRMLPPNPWCSGGGLSDAVAVSGEEDRERYIRMGVPQTKIVITGEPSHDSLFEAREAKTSLLSELRTRYGLSAEGKVIVCALPHLAEVEVMDWTQHWNEIEFLVESLASTGANVLVSLHPKSTFNKYEFLEGKFKVHLLHEPLRDVLPVADIFVATYSSTVRWAVLLGIPTIVVDFYNFNLSIYDHLKGVVKVTEKPMLLPTLDKILNDAAYYQSLQRGQYEDGQKIAPFDGNANKRIIDLINKLTVASQ